MKYIANAVLVILLTTSSGFCGDVMGPEDGINYYYGIGCKKNYQKALESFQSAGEDGYFFLILMYLNGDGVPADPQKALGVWNKSQESVAGNNQTYYKYKEIIDERIAHPKKVFERLGCGDVAMTTYDMDVCASIDIALQNQLGNQQIKEIENKLNAVSRKKYDEINKIFNVIVENDVNRVDLGYYRGGTMRGLDMSGTQQELKSWHQTISKDWLLDGILERATKNDFQMADKELNLQYKNVWKEVEDELKDVQENPQTPEDYENYSGVLINAQRAWIQYRDKWVVLLLMNKPNGFTNDKNIEWSVKTALTRERIKEFRDRNN